MCRPKARLSMSTSYSLTLTTPPILIACLPYDNYKGSSISIRSFVYSLRIVLLYLNILLHYIISVFTYLFSWSVGQLNLGSICWINSMTKYCAFIIQKQLCRTCHRFGQAKLHYGGFFGLCHIWYCPSS